VGSKWGTEKVGSKWGEATEVEMVVLTHCWPDVEAYSGKLRQNLRFVPKADIAHAILVCWEQVKAAI